MASYRPVKLPVEADSFGISHEDSLAVSIAQSFPRFPELPPEIRAQIWRHCLPGPRVVEVHVGTRSEFLYSKYPPPIALIICRESRTEALKCYEASFDSRPNAGRIYFDFFRDSLHFQDYCAFSDFPRDETLRSIGQDLARVKSISCSLDASGAFRQRYLTNLRKFEALEQITLLIPPGGPDGPDRILVDPSTVTLSPAFSFGAIEFSELDANQTATLKISFMSYISGDYRVC